MVMRARVLRSAHLALRCARLWGWGGMSMISIMSILVENSYILTTAAWYAYSYLHVAEITGTGTTSSYISEVVFDA